MAKGGGIIEWRQREFMAEVSGQLANNMLAACEFVAGEAQARAPKRTGTLASEIDVAVEVTAKDQEITGWVGVKRGQAFYAYFQELGTSRHAAQPFLRPAVFNNAKKIVSIVAGEISVGGFRRGTSRRGSKSKRGSKVLKRLKFKPRIPRLKVPRIPRLKLPKVRRPSLPKPPKLHIPRF